MPNLKSKVSLKERVEEVLNNLLPQGETGDLSTPEKVDLYALGFNGLHRAVKGRIPDALSALHAILKESMPKERDTFDPTYNRGYNAALSQVNQVLEGLGK